MLYYSLNSQEYISSSSKLDMSELYSMFLPRLKGKKILDVGFGSGRDMLYFRSLGYEVEGIDNEISFVEHALALGLKATCVDMKDYRPAYRFDGIWACASLLHLHKEELVDTISHLISLLNEGGTFFLSLKEGEEEVIDEKGRVMTYVKEDFLKGLGFKIMPSTSDSLGRDVRWINAVYTREE